MTTTCSTTPRRTAAAGLLLLGAAVAALAAPPPPKPPKPSPDPQREVRILRHAGHEPMILPLGKGYLGIELTELTPELLEHFGVAGDNGVMVARVAEGSPAEKAGIQVGDVVTSVDGAEVESTWDLRSRIRKKEDGDQVPVEVWRDGKTRTLTVTIAEKERPELDLGPMFMKRREGDDVILRLDPDQMGKRIERFQVEGPDGEGPPLIRFRSREAELEKQLRDLEKRIADLERQLEKKN